MADWERRTRTDYQRKGFAARSGFGAHPALLVVDFICGFTDPDSPLGGDYAAELAVTATLLSAFRECAAPVVFTTTEYRPDFADGGHFVAKVPALRLLVENSPPTRIDPRIAPAPGERVVSKRYASAFFGTDAAEHLHAAGTDTVVVVGCTTSGCVRASAVDALQHGFRTVVVSDAVGDRADGPHRANLFDLDAKYADVIPASAVLEALAALPR